MEKYLNTSKNNIPLLYMSYLPLLTYVIILIVMYITDIVGNGINKMAYDKSDRDFTIFSFVFNIIWGLIIYYTCYIGYNTLPWVLTAIPLFSLIGYFLLELANIKIEYTTVEDEKAKEQNFLI
jgi:hypothetical protein